MSPEEPSPEIPAELSNADSEAADGAFSQATEDDYNPQAEVRVDMTWYDGANDTTQGILSVRWVGLQPSPEEVCMVVDRLAAQRPTGQISATPAQPTPMDMCRRLTCGHRRDRHYDAPTAGGMPTTGACSICEESIPCPAFLGQWTEEDG